MLDFLRHEGIDAQIIKRIEDFRNTYPVSTEMAGRVPAPKYHYYGKDVWEKALTALISGENLLLVGPKATGKKRSGGESGRGFRPAGMGYLLLPEYRRRLSHRHGHL